MEGESDSKKDTWIVSVFLDLCLLSSFVFLSAFDGTQGHALVLTFDVYKNVIYTFIFFMSVIIYCSFLKFVFMVYHMTIFEFFLWENGY